MAKLINQKVFALLYRLIWEICNWELVKDNETGSVKGEREKYQDLDVLREGCNDKLSDSVNLFWVDTYESMLGHLYLSFSWNINRGIFQLKIQDFSALYCV